MPGHIGLYYPHIAFPSDGWVKLAALYWDKLGRIVPPDYPLQDSDTVQRLSGELGFVENFFPSIIDTSEVGQMFLGLINVYGQQLVERYSILGHSVDDSQLAYVYCDKKMSYALRRALQDNFLAVSRSVMLRPPPYRGEQIGMHPKLAFVYMETLAAQMASRRQLHAVTDNVHAHLAAGGYTLERLVQALLEVDGGRQPLVGPAPTQYEVEKMMAAIALQSILPRDIASVPVEKIIQLRKMHRMELTAFQTHIHDIVANLDMLQQIDDPVALRAHLEVVYERDLKLQLDDLKKSLKSLAIETVSGVLNIRVALPSFVASAGAALHLAPLPPEVAGIGAIACSILPVFQQKRTSTREKVSTYPVSYLLYAQEGLTPATLVSRVVRGARQMFFGV